MGDMVENGKQHQPRTVRAALCSGKATAQVRQPPTVSSPLPAAPCGPLPEAIPRAERAMKFGKCVCMLSRFNCVRLSATLWTVAH